MKGMDAVAVLGEDRWEQGDPLPEDGAFACSAGDLDPTAPLAIGDLDPVEDSDGRPEIVANHEQDGLVIFDHWGRRITEGFLGGINQGPNPAPSIANLNGIGPAEIVLGQTVFTLMMID